MRASNVGAPSSKPIVIWIVWPGAPSPDQVPNQLGVWSGSVTLAHTSAMGARKVRVTIRSRPSRRPVGVGVIGSFCRQQPPVGGLAADLELQLDVVGRERGDGVLVQRRAV